MDARVPILFLPCLPPTSLIRRTGPFRLTCTHRSRVTSSSSLRTPLDPPPRKTGTKQTRSPAYEDRHLEGPGLLGPEKRSAPGSPRTPDGPLSCLDSHPPGRKRTSCGTLQGKWVERGPGRVRFEETGVEDGDTETSESWSVPPKERRGTRQFARGRKTSRGGGHRCTDTRTGGSQKITPEELLRLGPDPTPLTPSFPKGRERPILTYQKGRRVLRGEGQEKGFLPCGRTNHVWNK